MSLINDLKTEMTYVWNPTIVMSNGKRCQMRGRGFQIPYDDLERISEELRKFIQGHYGKKKKMVRFKVNDELDETDFMHVTVTRDNLRKKDTTYSMKYEENKGGSYVMNDVTSHELRQMWRFFAEADSSQKTITKYKEKFLA